MRILPVISLPLLLACTAASAAGLLINFSGLPSDRGKIMVAVYDSEASYKARKTVATARVPANGPLRAVFRDLPVGQYAVTVYHDENDNGIMDRNFMGIPQEAYGFSRNPGARFGPPPFADMAFTLDKESTQIEIIVE